MSRNYSPSAASPSIMSRCIAGSRPPQPSSSTPPAQPALYRAVDQHGQVIDVLVAERRDARAGREFFTRAIKHGPAPIKITTDRAPVYPRVIEDAVPGARHVLERYQKNRVQTEPGRLKARLRPMRGVKTIRSQRVLASGTRLHAEPTPRARRAHRRCRCSRPRPHRIHRTRPPLV